MNVIFFLLLSFFSSVVYADTISVNGVSFSDSEQNQTLLILSYSSYQDFINLSISQPNVYNLLNCRDNETIGFSCASAFLTSSDFRRIREYSHVIDFDNNITMRSYTPLGIRQRDFNFLMGLMGAFVGFAILLFFLYTLINVGIGLKKG